MPYQDDLRRYFGEIARYAEPALTAGSAAIAEPVSGLAGLGALLRGRGVDGAVESINAAQQAMTYQPRTMEGQQGLQGLQSFLQPVGEVIQGASQNLGDKAYSATGSPALAAAAYSAPTAFLEGLGLKGLSIARKPVSGTDLYTPRIFAGVKAKTADLAALDRAKALEAAGASRDQIWTETGWLNDGGDWKFEISDKDAALSPNAVKIPEEGFLNSYKINEALQHKALFDAYPEIGEKYLFTDPNMGWGEGGFIRDGNITLNKSNPQDWLIDAQKKLNDKLDPESPNFWEKTAQREYEAGEYKTLDEALENNKQWLDWDIADLDSMKARYWNETDLDTTIHELQHAVQSIEGFSTGGSPNANAVSAARARILDLIAPISEKIDSIEASQDYKIFLQQMRDSGMSRSEARQAAESRFGLDKLKEQLYTKSPLESAIYDEANQQYDSYKVYKRLGGEVEARKASKRLKMTADERKGRAPWLDTDVPENEIIPYKK